VCGEIGLSISQFDKLSWIQLDNITRGYEKKGREKWQQIRLIAFTSAFNFESKDKGLTAEKWYPFPWDKQPKKNKVSFKDALQFVSENQK
jgi:hypothetical protein